MAHYGPSSENHVLYRDWGTNRRGHVNQIFSEDRINQALQMPHRSGFDIPTDPLLECTLGRLLVRGKITLEEFNAAVKWRSAHMAYLASILDPDGMSDDDCENAAARYKQGTRILMNEGRRVFHAACAIATYDEPNGIGDLEYTTAAAKIGFAALARKF
jgi:hypothetical protein